jgi:hypothetical protein
MLQLQYGVLTFGTFFMHFPEEGEESLPTADCYSDLTFVEAKCFRETEETTEKSDDAGARISRDSKALQCFDVF